VGVNEEVVEEVEDLCCFDFEVETGLVRAGERGRHRLIADWVEVAVKVRSVNEAECAGSAYGSSCPVNG
jgi:hypothetical protein